MIQQHLWSRAVIPKIATMLPRTFRIMKLADSWCIYSSSSASKRYAASFNFVAGVQRQQITPRHLPIICAQPLRSFSSKRTGPSRPSDGNNAAESNKPEEYHHPQDFVNVKLEPGEWDPDYKDPLYRPPWRPGNVKIISPEDFENQPAVGFREEYDSFRDAMILMTWMDHSQFDRIYHRYCQLMVTMSERKPGKLSSTSHEFVMRVLAQEFRITAKRAAAIVQLRHNEEQIRKTNPELVHDEIAVYVDASAREEIAESYAAVNEVHPEEFMEQPARVNLFTHSDSRYVKLPDLYDEDDLWEKTLLREAEEARLIIDQHIYVEDIDESKVSIKLSAEYQNLLKAKEALEAEAKVMEEEAKVNVEAIPKPLPESGRTERRDRSTFVAFMTNTRDVKKRGFIPKHRRKKGDDKYENILIEHDGELRAATLAEVKKTSEKPARTGKEGTFAGVKKAWLERVTKQAKGGWGPQEAPLKTMSNDES